MRIDIGYGNGTQTLDIPDARVLDVLYPNRVENTLRGEAEAARALSCPIGSKRLRSIVKPGEKIAVVTSDITRPMPTYAVMPALLAELSAAGVRDQDITLVFALGSHRPMTEEEIRHLAGEEAFARIRCINGDPSDCVHLGTTRRDTPVDIVRTVAEADRRILLGNVEYHYFAGYSGGAKAIMPGVSTREAIQANHRMMIEEGAVVGNLDTNPLRQDLEEGASMCGVDFILNVVLDENKEIVHAAAGDMIAAHREACAFLDKMYRKMLPSRADIVIVSQGGAPKDLNLYQTQKALDNAKHAVKDGGIIILAGSCREGLGGSVFEEWLTGAKTPDELIERIRREFRLGGHKAAAIAMVLKRAEIFLMSDLDPGLVRNIFMTPYSTIQEAYEAAARKMGPDASVLVMPFGGSTLPDVAPGS